MRKRRYPTDMTDAEWAVVRPLLPVPGWLRGRGGQPEAYCHRVMLDAIRYLVDNGIKWRAMPVDFPLWDRVYAFFRRWRENALVREFHDRLRAAVREKLGRDAEPSTGVIDSQSVKADAVVGADSRGFDGGKLINGRIPATFVYAGIDLETSELMVGTRGAQIAGRFTLVPVGPFPYGKEWKGLIATMEESLILHDHPPGSLVKLDRYLHNRTDGMIGALSHVVRGAAIDAILNGTERVTKEGLDAIPLDHAAESVCPGGKPARQR
jgi:transposase